MQVKTRDQMDKKFCWNLSHIYASESDWENALKKADGLTADFAKLEGKIGADAESFKGALRLYSDLLNILEDTNIYASLLKEQDNSNQKAQAMEDKAMRQYVKSSAALSFFVPEILTIDEAKLREYMKSEGMGEFSHMLEDIIRTKPHILDKSREQLLAMAGDIFASPRQIYTMLSTVDMDYPTAKDDSGNDVQLTHGSFGVLRENRLKQVRKGAFEGMFGRYRDFGNTYAALYATSVKIDQYIADVRGYGSSLEEKLFDSNVPKSVFFSLIEGLKSKLGIMEKYLSLRKKALKLDELSYYDLYAPMVEDVEYDVDYEQAKQLVLDGMAPLGKEYQELLKESYENEWIDVYENKGKTTGAFCCGIYRPHPYVLLNFTGKLDDAFTLAHELGHAMHSYLSSKAQTYINKEYKILVAEVASTVNEVLLTRYLLGKETDKKRKAYILNHFLEGFRTTMFRQTLFAEFEEKAHRLGQEGGALTPEALNGIYSDLCKEYYSSAKIEDVIEAEWSYIPHFYGAYYVYQYATGFASAVTIADNILKTGDASDYLRFLSTGGSDYPLEELKIAGIDLTTPVPVTRAMEVFENTVEELRKLLED